MSKLNRRATRLLVAILCVALSLQGCALSNGEKPIGSSAANSGSVAQTASFEGLGDPELISCLEDAVYTQTIEKTTEDECFVENVEAAYISQEYLDELEFNTRSNVFFGYTAEELERQFGSDAYVFTLGEDGKTAVGSVQAYDATYDEVLRNISVGTGVILVCVTVSLVTSPVSAAASGVFAVAAKTGAAAALSDGAISAVSAGLATALATDGDIEAVLKSAALEGSRGYQVGAIVGSLAGGASEWSGLKGATTNGLDMDDAARIQRESKYPLSVIKEMASKEEYDVYKSQSLKPVRIDGRTVLVGDIDLNYKSLDSNGVEVTNLERMKNGYAAIDKDGNPYNVHHIGQRDGVFAILPERVHQEYTGVLHTSKNPLGAEKREEFNSVIRKQVWRGLSVQLAA